ncbi:MAG: type III secretion system chaperone [Puniceicoccales bacterium]|nr:type III secretion system chaperone [Puniceicoccales bacterium]
MENRAFINGMLGEVGRSLGLNLKLRDDGLCIIKQDQFETEYIIELSRTAALLHIYSPIGDLPQTNKADALEYLLKLNLHGLETNQCTIGLDAHTNKIVLSYSISTEILNANLLSNVICNFFTTVPKILKKIENFVQSDPQQSFEHSDNITQLLTIV